MCERKKSGQIFCGARKLLLSLTIRSNEEGRIAKFFFSFISLGNSFVPWKNICLMLFFSFPYIPKNPQTNDAQSNSILNYNTLFQLISTVIPKNLCLWFLAVVFSIQSHARISKGEVTYIYLLFVSTSSNSRSENRITSTWIARYNHYNHTINWSLKPPNSKNPCKSVKNSLWTPLFFASLFSFFQIWNQQRFYIKNGWVEVFWTWARPRRLFFTYLQSNLVPFSNEKCRTILPTRNISNSGSSFRCQSSIFWSMFSLYFITLSP